MSPDEVLIRRRKTLERLRELTLRALADPVADAMVVAEVAKMRRELLEDERTFPKLTATTLSPELAEARREVEQLAREVQRLNAAMVERIKEARKEVIERLQRLKGRKKPRWRSLGLNVKA